MTDDLVSFQATTNPERAAVICDGRQLTYRELEDRANQLAHHLRGLGLGPETPVGVCLDRSPELVVALLGVLRAGGVYVPLDPGYPAERLKFIVSDLAMPVVLRNGKRRHDWMSGVTHIVPVDDWSALADPPRTMPEVRLSPLNLAYVIYTSGTTGQPKGVGVTHEQLDYLVSSRLDFYEGRQPERFLLLVSHVFDGSLAVLVQSLVCGATVVMPSTSITADAGNFPAVVSTHGITHVLLGPALWRQILDDSGHPLPSVLRMVIVAGENVPADLVRLHHQRLRGVDLVNEYGPTECTVWATAGYCEPSMDNSYASIGRPLRGVTLHLLDQSLVPVPAGTIGEIFVGGPSVARGYVNRPDVTAERFVPDPFGPPGSRLYRTGDLARYLPDGRLLFEGRRDTQVKLRGYRVELGEVESWLREHPGVRDAVCLLREDAPGDRQLVAYVATGAAPVTAVSAVQLRSFLAEKLPEHLIPSAFVMLQALPLTSNGKVDRRALPVPTVSRETAVENHFVAPRDETERHLAQEWAAALGVERIGIHDNFFDLGGHSLMLARLHRKLVALAGRPISVVDVFRSPTIAEVARIMRSATEGIPHE